MDNNKLIADLLFPEIKSNVEYYEELYPRRHLPKEALVTRFAPSPTGFLHLGSLFTALISERLAHQSNGIFYLRIEDTDRKREIAGSVSEIVRGLLTYNIKFDEGSTDGYIEKGFYGPYKQSQREGIYKSYVKLLLEKGLAYPCFCTHEDLSELRKMQELQNITTGYYGRWAKHRSIILEEIKENLHQNKPYVIRLKSPGNPDVRISYRDLIKGDIEMPENLQDIVILKSDGLPTYHFAHVVDDHLMRTTHVIRADEWLPSIPIHLQLFDVLGFDRPQFAHISPIMKMDGTSKRKLSKRKDPELAFSYYEEQGYLPKSVIEYLFHIINSNFEDWRSQNKDNSYTDFKIDIENMSPAGALFDLNKLTDLSKEIISETTAVEVCNQYLKWAENYDPEMFELFCSNINYAVNILNIERELPKPRKDIGKWSDVREYAYFFYDKLYYSKSKNWNFPSSIKPENICEILENYSSAYSENDTKESWFNNLKIFAENHGYSSDVKAYKKNPLHYKGHVGDVAMILRVALTKKANTPDLFEIIKLLGSARLSERLSGALNEVRSRF